VRQSGHRAAAEREEKHNASFDLGLVLFHLAEKYGQRFGEEEQGDAGAIDPQRILEIECAQILLGAIAHDAKVPIDLRARAHYLAGNLEFMRRAYETAVRSYDEALALIPGLEPDAGGDAIGSDAAWNRAIALRRIQDQEDAGQDGGQDAEPDANDGGEDASPDSGDDGGDGGGPDAGEDGGGQDGGDDGGNQDQQPDAGGEPDAGEDAGGGQDPEQEPEPADEDPEQAPSGRSQMDQLLDELEEAPSYQEEDAKRNAAERRGRKVMEDK
jgi:hypothetical protein